MWKCVDWKKQEMVFSAQYSFLNNMCAFCSNMPIYFPVWFNILWKHVDYSTSQAREHSKNFGKGSKASDQIRSVTQSCPTLCDPMNRSMPGLPVHHQLPEFTQTHVRWVSDAIQPSHPLSSPSPPAPNPSQHQSLFQWVNSSHEVAKVLEFQLQHHSFQRNPRADLLKK